MGGVGGRAFPGRGVAVGTQGSRQLGARMAVSGSCITGAVGGEGGQRRGQDGGGVLGSPEREGMIFTIRGWGADAASCSPPPQG